MKDWFVLAGTFVSGGLLTAYVMFWLYQHPEVAKQWASIFYGLLSQVWAKYKYKSTKYRLESKLNVFANELADFDDLDQTKVKIEWTAKGGEVSGHKLEENEIVIVMRDRGSDNKNFINAAYYYVSHMLLWRAKKHTSKKQGQAIDVYTTKKIIESQDRAAYRLFMEDYFQPLLEDEKVKEMINKFVEIDESGFYTHILLKELGYLGTKTMMSSKDKRIAEEVSALINFLYGFASREVGDESTIDEFIGSYSKCSIKIVSTYMVRALEKTQGPAKRVLTAFEHGVENVYVIGPVDDNGEHFVNEVCELVVGSRQSCKVVCEKTFTGKTKRRGETKRVPTYYVQIQDLSKADYVVSQNDVARIDQLRDMEQRE